jgi:hypothetical protein
MNLHLPLITSTSPYNSNPSVLFIKSLQAHQPSSEFDADLGQISNLNLNPPTLMQKEIVCSTPVGPESVRKVR